MSTHILIYLFAVVGVAAIIRGYIGFGFSALVVSSAALVMPAAQIVPIILMLEVLASVYLLPKVWHKLNWKILAGVLAGTILGTPLGQWLLVFLPAKPMQITLSVTVLLVSVLIWRGVTLKNSGTLPMLVFAGFVCGVVNGATAMGGVVAVILLLSIKVEASVIRAVLIGYFFFSDIFASLIAYSHGLISSSSIVHTLVLLIPLLIGLYIGQRKYHASQPESFKKVVLCMLVFLSLLNLVRAAM